ncbi:MAG: DedA family protein [Deltaproteobacteria bacterium]|nr:DedA family protein [Candidatus Zymogenaceae bacterium]
MPKTSFVNRAVRATVDGCPALDATAEKSITVITKTVVKMDLLNLITLFGYPVILMGTFFAGEMVLILGGFAAHRGYLDLPLVVLCAFCGALAGDQFFFFIGQYKSRAFLDRRPEWRKRISTVEGYIDRFRTLFVLGFRFVYGLRTVSPFVLGMGDIRPAAFIVLDTAGVLAWAILVGWLGYVFGSVMGIVIEDIERYEIEIFGAILVVGLGVRFIQVCRKRKIPRSS